MIGAEGRRVPRYWGRLAGNGPVRMAVLVVMVVLVLGVLARSEQQGLMLSPQAVVRDYLNSIYAGDYSRAYSLISSADQAYKLQEEYLREQNPLTGTALVLSRQLASYVEYTEIQLESEGKRAVATAHMLVPNGNSPAVREILFESSADGNQRKRMLHTLHALGQIPMLDAEQTVQLLRERSGWRIYASWAEAIPIHFSGEVFEGLPWEFAPVQEIVLAKPGETLWNSYRAKNLSTQAVTGKARHLDSPAIYAAHLEIVQCFCLVQQELRPGEETQMPLVFRLAPDLPPQADALYIHYEFYPLTSFPGE